MKLADLQRSPFSRLLLLTAFYTIALTASLWVSYLLRFDFEINEMPPRIDQAQKLETIRMYFLWVIR